jgi:hypothetical protein
MDTLGIAFIVGGSAFLCGGLLFLLPSERKLSSSDKTFEESQAQNEYYLSEMRNNDER